MNRDPVRRELAPSGTLRVAINYGNAVLAQKDAQSGEPRGVSVDIAKEIGRRLGLPVEFVTFDAAGKVFAAIGQWDMAFLAIDPARATQIDFTPPYVIIEGSYMVPADSPLRTVDDVDRAGVRIAVGQGSAYELHLSRNIRNAQIVKAATGNEAIAMFEREGLEACAGVKSPLSRYASTRPQLRVMDGRFMVIEQAVGTPKGRAAANAYLRDVVEELKASGFVAEGLARSGQRDALVAPKA
jgi:polar amino acid transport system substrate-binding protein